MRRQQVFVREYGQWDGRTDECGQGTQRDEPSSFPVGAIRPDGDVFEFFDELDRVPDPFRWIRGHPSLDQGMKRLRTRSSKN
ncbi:hypothetical protein [Actinomadura sp. WAC 06369]|uniref:hypothetical protein n=1 Tax=Actinomadura sp. WAC 06369 TaxID=2203193 RepID=UPI001F2085C6|nr:hypothetical protein [Actinomadura sp. WAC 06369]